MDEMGLTQDGPIKTRDRIMRSCYRAFGKGGFRSIQFKKHIAQILMKEWPPEATTTPHNAERQVTVYLEGTGKLWIDTNDLEWLIRTLWIEPKILPEDAAVDSDSEGPGARVRMEADMTPEKLRHTQQCQGHLHEKGDDPPF